jgi:hypothetical protein
MIHPLVEYFRCPEHLAAVGTANQLSSDKGYFRFRDAICYGRQSVGTSSPIPDDSLVDVSGAVALAGGKSLLPFDLSEVVENLRQERYPEAQRAVDRMSTVSLSHEVYYFFRPLLPVGVRKYIQRLHWKKWKEIPFPQWPVDTTVEKLMRHAAGAVLQLGGIGELPFIWFWPDGASGCAIMTHDVEGPDGMAFCGQLMDMDDKFGVRSAFQLIPEGPRSPKPAMMQLIEQLKRRGFEVNVHDLNHDGHLFRRRDEFLRRASKINARGKELGSRGFRSGALYRRQDWFEDLDFSYDMSVPNVAHLEPQAGGCCTVMPYFLGRMLELPLTAAQDYTLFHILGTYSTRLWQEQTDAVLAEHGLLSFNTHPDYLIERRARDSYTELLRLVAGLRDQRDVWVAPPAEVNQWWRERREMRLVPDGASWRIEGPGSERARVAYARHVGERVVYEVGRTERAA